MKILKLRILQVLLASMFSVSAHAVITGSHGGDVSAPGLTSSAQITKAVCETADKSLTIYFSIFKAGGKRKGSVSYLTYTMMDNVNKNLIGTPNERLELDLMATGYEQILLESYMWTYLGPNTNDAFAFVLSGEENPKPGMYDMSLAVILNKSINVPVEELLVCKDVELESL